MIPDEKQIKTYRNGYNYALNTHLDEMNINHIDLLPELRQLTKISGHTYYNSPHDFHLNKEGYTLVAKNVFDNIKESLNSTQEQRHENNRGFHTYRDGTTTILSSDDFSKEKTTNDNAHNTTTNNIAITSTTISGGNYTLLSKKTGNEEIGTLSIAIDSKKSIRRFTVITPVRIGANRTGSVNVYYSCDGGPPTEITRYVNTANEDQAFETIPFEEISLHEPCNKLNIIYHLYGNSTLFFNDVKNDDRKIKVIKYH